jgi:hypothetical protein
LSFETTLSFSRWGVQQPPLDPSRQIKTLSLKLVSTFWVSAWISLSHLLPVWIRPIHMGSALTLPQIILPKYVQHANYSACCTVHLWYFASSNILFILNNMRREMVRQMGQSSKPQLYLDEARCQLLCPKKA